MKINIDALCEYLENKIKEIFNRNDLTLTDGISKELLNFYFRTYENGIIDAAHELNDFSNKIIKSIHEIEILSEKL